MKHASTPSLEMLMHHPPIVVGIGVLVVGFLLYKTIHLLGKVVKLILMAGFVGGLGYLLVSLKNGVTHWQQTELHPVHHTKAHANHLLGIPKGPVNLTGTNPLVHQSPWLVAGAILFLAVFGLGYLAYRGMEPQHRAEFLNRIRFTTGSGRPKVRATKGEEFPLVGIELGMNKQTGKPIRIDGKDRFINTLVHGSIGTGKSSRVLKKGVYQDLYNISNGEAMDCIVMDPDGGLVDSSIDMAKRLGIPTYIIDMRGQGARQSNVSFDPFSGGDISDILDNVRAVLSEQMGHQDAFFQNAQDDLVRTVIQVQIPLWPDTDFIKFSELVTDPIHFQQICKMVVYTPSASAKKGKKKDQDTWEDLIDPQWRHEIAYVRTKFASLPTHLQSMVESAARSFLSDTRTDAKMEHLEKVTKGLKIVVNEISTNAKMRQVLEKGDLPVFDFQSFLANDRKPGRLVAVVTGNRPVGDLFGKLFLVSLKMYGLSRPGTEDTRRPVYLWVDEFPRFATESLGDYFAQARKYRIAGTVAIQARSQLQLYSNRGFVNVVEGSCRNKIYFPSPAPEDAKYLQETLGSVVNVQTTHQENRLGFLFFDSRNLDRRVSTKEQVDPRYRIEDLLYELSKDEAIFVMTEDNQAQPPIVGYTSYADVWAKKRLRIKPKKEKREKRQQGQEVASETATVQVTDVQHESVHPAPSHAEEVVATAPRVAVDKSPSKPSSGARTTRKLRAENVQNTPKGKSFRDAHAQTGTKDNVIPLSELMGTAEQAKASKPVRASVQSPQADRDSSPTPEKQEPAENKITGKKCSACNAAFMELNKDGTKYICPECGLEKKNRKG